MNKKYIAIFYQVTTSVYGIRVLTIYMGKPEILVGKSNGSRHSVREASETMGRDLR